MPMPPIVTRSVACPMRPYHHMGYAATDFVIAPRAPIDLHGSRARYRHDNVFVAVGAVLHALLQRR